MLFQRNRTFQILAEIPGPYNYSLWPLTSIVLVKEGEEEAASQQQEGEGSHCSHSSPTLKQQVGPVLESNSCSICLRLCKYTHTSLQCIVRHAYTQPRSLHMSHTIGGCTCPVQTMGTCVGWYAAQFCVGRYKEPRTCSAQHTSTCRDTVEGIAAERHLLPQNEHIRRLIRSAFGQTLSHLRPGEEEHKHQSCIEVHIYNRQSSIENTMYWGTYRTYIYKCIECLTCAGSQQCAR